jgi:glutathione reductase (NADPH)
MNDSHRFDLFIIGAGSAGVRAGRSAAQRGARVAVAEDAALGGTCVNLGCIPKKLYSFAAHYHERFAEASGFGWKVAAPSFDWETLKANRRAELARLNGVYGDLLESAGATIVRGRARVVGTHAVEVGGVRYQSERIVVATGGWPVPAGVPGGERAISSNEIFDLARFPSRPVVVGGGCIAASSRRSSTGSARR